MSDFKTAVEELNNITSLKGAGSKKAIQEALTDASDITISLIKCALDPYTIYHVKKWKAPSAHAPEDADPELFFGLLNSLSNREVTGNEALGLVQHILSLYTAETAEWLSKVLRKDLKSGFSAETVNLALTGKKRPADPIVPVYACMLAKKMDKKYPWAFPLIIEAKYDGQRCNAIVNPKTGDVTYHARSGKIMEHVMGIFDVELVRLAQSMEYDKAIVFDGEVMSSDFTKTMNAKGSKNQEARDSLQFFIYDFVPLDEWKVESGKMTQMNRTELLDAHINRNNFDRLNKSEWAWINTREEASGFHERVVEAGYEGTVLKEPDHTYKWDRSIAWTKWKPVETFDLRITGFYPGREGTKYENMLGGAHVEGTDENGNEVSCNVGSGFSDKQREEIWNNQDKYMDRMIECEADPNLSSVDGRGVLAMRWGVFKRFREDKE